MTIGKLPDFDAPAPLDAAIAARVSEIVEHQRFVCLCADGQRLALRLGSPRGRQYLGIDPAEEGRIASVAEAGRPQGEHEWFLAMKWVARYFEASWGLVMAGLGASGTDGVGQVVDHGAYAARMIALLES